ncbi:Carboxypeptidase S [Wickerhamomyces ciferrii]|uniref:Carboxypeptidase S n=1 Tax=Wickerhamomyces ciferrii (strain ATCC 14091 / BCRC 22168 / CBS 111 / JCM 3599 / NBRC 0793 / NRRL Y-1031 F-60-10) TaxID=1206466 RepID=K0KHC4_WICCF|nr:Carboxypeptidase S [Wickerhamomyces ciferrii]CCH42406.1 Carboxypeptidase S [Wickerhamomyces ciferrii]
MTDFVDEKRELSELELPVTTKRKDNKKSHLVKHLLSTLLVGGLFYLTTNGFFNCHQGKETTITRFPQPEPVRPNNYFAGTNSANKIYYDDDFKNKSIEKLAGAVRIETESYDNNPRPIEDLKNWIKFYKLHDYLEKTFPLFHKHLTREKVEKISLLYTWEGSNPDLKPLLLAAHQDVVPIDPSTRHLWTHDPYAGVYDGKYIWGRGVSDCKDLLIGTFEAVEQLIEDGFKPERTILFAFGNDEESTSFGAGALSEHIEKRYGKDSIFALVDEGTGVLQVDGQQIAAPSTAEKGHIDFYLELTTPGGHSSVPPDHTSIGIISKFVTLLEANPNKPRISSKNPFVQYLQVAYEDSDKISNSFKQDLANVDNDKHAQERLIEFLSKDKSTRYAIRTSQAIDVVHGGVKSNALPEYVTLVVNQRIDIHSSLNETYERFLTHLKTIAKEFDLGIEFDGTVLSKPTENGNFRITLGGPLEPAPVTPSSGPVWDLFSGTIKHVYDDIVNKDNDKKLKVAPFTMLGNTDTKHYWDLTKNIFRFQGNLNDPESMSSGIHSVNERLTPEEHLQVITFLYEFILNVDQAR